MTYPEVDHVGRSGAAIILTCETDASTPLKPGETKMGGLDAPLRGRLDVTTGSSVVDMGLQGKMSCTLNSMTTMAGALRT